MLSKEVEESVWGVEEYLPKRKNTCPKKEEYHPKKEVDPLIPGIQITGHNPPG